MLGDTNRLSLLPVLSHREPIFPFIFLPCSIRIFLPSLPTFLFFIALGSIDTFAFLFVFLFQGYQESIPAATLNRLFLLTRLMKERPESDEEAQRKASENKKERYTRERERGESEASGRDTIAPFPFGRA